MKYLSGLTKKSSYACRAKGGAVGLALLVSFPGLSGGVPVLNDYRTIAGGSLDSPGIWEQLTSAGWVTVSGAPDATTPGTLFILHPVTTSGIASRARLTIGAGGVLTTTGALGVTNEVLVQSNGLLQLNNQLTVGSSATFTVDNGGSVAVNHTFANPETSLWNGLESFAPASNFIFQNWNSSLPVVNNALPISETTVNGFSAAFGNLVFDLGPAQVSGLTVLQAGVSRNLTHGNVSFISAAPGSSVIMGGIGATIKGNLVIGSGFSGSTLFLSSSALTIGGNVTQQGGSVFAAAGNASIATLALGGSLAVTGGTFDLLPSTSATGAGVTLTLSGNLEVASTATLTNSHTAAGDAGRVAFNFGGTGAQTVTVAPLVAAIPFRVIPGATVVLGANLRVNRSTIATIVQAGGTLNFNGFNFEGTSGFTQLDGSTLRITSPLGLGNGGNVQSSADGRNFGKAGIYHFTGTVPQVTGTGLNPAAGQKVIIIDNPTTVTFSQPVSISTTGGGIDIRKGAMVETEAGYVAISNTSNTVQLLMSANTTYRSSTPGSAFPSSHASFPQAAGVWTLDASSTIELSGTALQTLRSTNTTSGTPAKTYAHLTFGGSGLKMLSNNVANIGGTVIIKDNAVLETEARSFGGNETNFTMTGGRFRTKRSSTQPMMNGIYNLTGGVVEFYGTTATSATQTVRGGKTYYSIEITAEAANTNSYNVLNGAGMVTVAEEFRVKAPAVYQIAGSNNYIIGTSATTGSFMLEPGATLKYGDKYGITEEACGTAATCGNIRTAQRFFPEVASYGVIGSAANMVTGNGLPATVESFYLERSNSNLVTLTNPLTIAGAVSFKNGKLKTTNGTLVTFLPDASHTGVSGISYISGPVSKSGTESFVFPIGDDATFAPAGISASAHSSTFQAQYAKQNPATGVNTTSVYAAPIYQLLNREYWEIRRTAGTAVVEVVLSYNEGRSGLVTEPENLIVARYTKSDKWVSEGSKLEGPLLPVGYLTTANPIGNFGLFSLAISQPGQTSTPLPIELISFSARMLNKVAELSWVTATEKDNAYFEVERSQDGKFFTPIAKIVSKGDSDARQTYQYTDYSPLAGATYYRLRQTDYDGTSTVSSPVSVRNQAATFAVSDVYPNPAGASASLTIEAQVTELLHCRILNQLGQVVLQKTELARVGSTTFVLSTQNLTPGSYLLEVISPMGKQVRKFLKQ